MKNLLIFLFGAACGAGGTLLWLRKDIKKELEKAREEAEKAAELPFTMGDGTDKENEEKCSRSDSEGSEGHSEEPVAVRKETRTEYHKLISNIKGDEPSILQTPVNAGAVIPEVYLAERKESDDTENDIKLSSKSGAEFAEIDLSEFKENDEYEKERYVYFLCS